MNNDPACAAPDPSTAIRPAVATPCAPAALDEALVERSLGDGADRRGNRATRGDGWTPERIRTFLVTLADCGVVTDAARAAGMSIRSAYNLRNRAEGRAFHYAWEAALQIAKRRLADALMSRAMHGCVDQLRRDGQVVAERCRFDNRLSMATLTRLDQRAAASDEEAEAVRIVVAGFDRFVEVASAGGAEAAEFIAARRPMRSCAAPPQPDAAASPSPARMIDISDLDPIERANWTEDQQDRARRAGIIGRRDWPHEGAWPSAIPEHVAPLIAEHRCWPMPGGGWLAWERPHDPALDANGNHELPEL